MVIYKRLSVAEGGGIENSFCKGRKTDTATVCIGLGGTGREVLQKLKGKVFRYLCPDDEDALVPSYSNIRFLLIDTDAEGLDRGPAMSRLDRQTEYFDISGGAIQAAFAAGDILKRRNEMKWLNCENIIVGRNEHGSGGIRQVGRYLLIDKARELREKLETVIQEAVDTSEEGRVDICIFSGLCGGVGGGGFLDTCYIVQDVLESLKSQNKYGTLYGFFFLPDVTLANPEIDDNSSRRDFMKVNGYAALKELDYLMALEENGGRFRQDYGTFEVDTKRPPIDICYLLSAADDKGRSAENGYERALETAAEYVFNFYFRSYMSLPSGIPESFDVSPLAQVWNWHSWTENIIRKIHGAFHSYWFIGVSCAEMPMRDVATYLGAKLFERFDSMFDATPTDNQLQEFVTKNQLSYEQILSRLTKGVGFNVPFPKYDAKDLIASNRMPVEKADAWTATSLGKFQENRKAMEEKLKDYKIPDTTTSLISLIYSSLYYTTYATDPKYGPIFAMRMLCGRNNKNLLHIIDGYIAKNEEKMFAEIRQDQLRRNDLENAEAQLRSARTGLFGNADKRANDYLGALNNWYVHLLNIDKFKYMQSLLHSLRSQIQDLNEDFFEVLATVLNNLKDTFEDNARRLLSGAGSGSSLGWRILDIPDIQSRLDDAVQNVDVSQVMRSFIVRMFDEYPKWLSQDPNEITQLISDFIIRQFSDITQETIKDFLQIKFNTTDPIVLKNRIKTDIIQDQLATKADPLFWRNSLFHMDEVARNSTIFVPFNTPEIVYAAEEYGKPEGVSIRKTGLTDRIFMMRFYTGVPLYAYQGLVELEKAYEADTSAGRHLYEAGEVDWRKFLPSPIPDSFRVPGHEMGRIIERNKKLGDELETAKAKGIVFYDTVNWLVKVTKNMDLDAVCGDYCVGDRVDQSKLSKMINSLKECQANMYDGQNVIETIPISIKGAKYGAEEEVFRDNYLRFPDVEVIVEKELEKAAALEKTIRELEAELTVGGK